MKALTLKLSIFFGGLIAISTTIDYFLPLGYGNWIYSCKNQQLKTNFENTNTVVFGSSRIYRQMNPILFDSVLAEHQIRSFNLGAAATFYPEMLYLVEEFLDDKNHNIKYVLVELQSVVKVSDDNIGTIQNTYWQNPKDLAWVTNYYFDKDDRKPVKFLTNYYLGYAFKIFNLEKIRYLDGIKNCGKKHPMIRMRGYYPLEQQLNNGSNTKSLRQRRDDYLSDTTVNQKRRKIALNTTTNISGHRVYIERLKRLRSLAKERNIHLLFVIPPRLPKYDEVYAAKKAINDNYVLDLADPNEFPKFYQTSFSFDVAHLNNAGAQKFTIELARKFEAFIQTNR